jgi:hypothetical protein
MVLSKPQDIAVLLGIVSVVFIMMYYAAAGFEANPLNQSNELDSSFYSDVKSDVRSSEGFYGASRDAQRVGETNTSETGDGNEASLIKRGFTAFLNLQKSWAKMWTYGKQLTEELIIPSEYLWIIFGLLSISFIIVIYTWLRAT